MLVDQSKYILNPFITQFVAYGGHFKKYPRIN